MTTSGEREELENSADIDCDAWYQDEVGNHMVDNKKESKIKYAATEVLYNVDGEQ